MSKVREKMVNSNTAKWNVSIKDMTFETVQFSLKYSHNDTDNSFFFLSLNELWFDRWYTVFFSLPKCKSTRESLKQRLKHLGRNSRWVPLMSHSFTHFRKHREQSWKYISPLITRNPRKLEPIIFWLPWTEKLEPQTQKTNWNWSNWYLRTTCIFHF